MTRGGKTKKSIDVEKRSKKNKNVKKRKKRDKNLKKTWVNVE